MVPQYCLAAASRERRKTFAAPPPPSFRRTPHGDQLPAISCFACDGYRRLKLVESKKARNEGRDRRACKSSIVASCCCSSIAAATAATADCQHNVRRLVVVLHFRSHAFIAC